MTVDVLQAERHFPVFDTVPSDEFIAAWHEHIQATGYPELFDNVSTARPYNLADVRLLSGELKVSVLRREDQLRIPCPLCSPNSPKFTIGRMAWFPHEKTALFIGHDCARRHIGADYVAADRQYRKEAKARAILNIWGELESRVPKLRAFCEALMPLAQAVENARADFGKDAAEFLRFMESEFRAEGGRISHLVDTGLRDQKRKKVYETIQLGTLVGREFLDPIAPATQLRRILKVLLNLDEPLPAWTSGDEDSEKLDELLHRGQKTISAIKQIRVVRDCIANARVFLHENNLDLFERWGKLDSSPFERLDFRRKGSWIFLDAIWYAGHHKASFKVSDDLLKQIPDVDVALLRINGFGEAV